MTIKELSNELYLTQRLSDAKIRKEKAKAKQAKAVALFFQVATCSIVGGGIALLLNGFFL